MHVFISEHMTALLHVCVIVCMLAVVEFKFLGLCTLVDYVHFFLSLYLLFYISKENIVILHLTATDTGTLFWITIFH